MTKAKIFMVLFGLAAVAGMAIVFSKEHRFIEKARAACLLGRANEFKALYCPVPGIRQPCNIPKDSWLSDISLKEIHEGKRLEVCYESLSRKEIMCLVYNVSEMDGNLCILPQSR